MIEKLFTSKTRTKLLDLFLFNQDKDYHLREIARLIKKTPVYVAKELDNLIFLGIVVKSKKAHLSIYSVNKECIFLEELKSIFLKTEYKKGKKRIKSGR